MGLEVGVLGFMDWNWASMQKLWTTLPVGALEAPRAGRAALLDCSLALLQSWLHMPPHGCFLSTSRGQLPAYGLQSILWK